MLGTFFSISLLILSCSTDVSSESLENTVEVSNTSEDLTIDYSADWEAFKRAARAKDQVGLKALSTEEVTDFQGLSFMLNELFVLKGMDETSFNDLKVVELEGETYLQFYAEEIGIDSEGYDFGTSITLLFIKTEAGLRLDRYLAAG